MRWCSFLPETNLEVTFRPIVVGAISLIELPRIVKNKLEKKN
jgi:hypothetical protein